MTYSLKGMFNIPLAYSMIDDILFNANVDVITIDTYSTFLK